MAADWRPRIQLDVTPELYHQLQDVIPNGLRQSVLMLLIEDFTMVVSALPQEGRNLLFGGILAKKFRLRDIVALTEAAYGNDR